MDSSQPATTTVTQNVYLDDNTALSIEYHADLGQLLIATMLFLFIMLYTLKWLHTLIMERKADV